MLTWLFCMHLEKNDMAPVMCCNCLPIEVPLHIVRAGIKILAQLFEQAPK